MTFTRGKLARLAGLSDDLAAHWVREGLLAPLGETTGTGSHREFALFQVHKAALLAHLRRLGSNIGALRWFAAALERGAELASGIPEATSDEAWRAATLGERLERFARGEQRVFNLDYRTETSDHEPAWVLAQSEDEVVRDVMQNETADPDRVLALARAVVDSAYDRTCLEMYADLINERVLAPERRDQPIWLAWPVGEGWRVFHSGEATNLSGMTEEISGGLYLNVGLIIRNVWVA